MICVLYITTHSHQDNQPYIFKIFRVKGKKQLVDLIREFITLEVNFCFCFKVSHLDMNTVYNGYICWNIISFYKNSFRKIILLLHIY